MFNERMFSELRLVPVQEMRETFSDADMVRAITDNENLTSLGYTLKPADIVKLAKSDICIYETVKAYVDKVEADPMYPDFPNQVMEMDEATFRFHQMVHYFSTYGMETLFGVKVSKGWLPDVSKTKKTKKQDAALPSKTISLIDEEKKYLFVMEKLLGKRERLTLPEKELIAEAAKHVSPEEIAKMPIPFKENLMGLFFLFFEEKEDDAIRAICQHTGDVLTCIRYLLTRHHYKLTTSQRKRCVKLLESYPTVDFRANLILSNKKAKNSLLVLEYLSYNKFSRSVEHRKAVDALRDGKLRSWESGMKKMLFAKDANVIPYLAERPGMLLRMVAWLLRLGYQEKDILSALKENAKGLSMQTLVTILNCFASSDFADRKERDGVFRIACSVLGERMTYLNTPLKGKKVFVDEGIYDFALSRIEANEKSEEGGYIRSGLTFRIPDIVKILRFFVYWNDEDRVDIDLHSYAIDKDDRPIHVGWNSDFRKEGICHSGDITHSDAAEYIDVNLDHTRVKRCINDIVIYSGHPDFAHIATCFTGLMGVSDFKEDVELYNPKNCFVYHNLSGKDRMLRYCLIDVEKRRMQLLAKPTLTSTSFVPELETGFSLKHYLELLFAAQEVEVVEKKEDADVTIQLDKGADICLIDENYFMDA